MGGRLGGTVCVPRLRGRLKLTTPDTIQGHAKEPDSVARVRTGVWVPGTHVIGGYNPAFYVTWFLRQANGSTKREEYDDNPKWTVQIVSTDSANTVDTLLTGVSATATIDYDTLAAIVDDSLTASHGAGSWASSAAGTGAYADSVYLLLSTDSSAIGSGITVWLTPNGGGSVLKDLTDANSWAVFSVDADTYLVNTWAVGYYAATVPDTNAVPGANTKDTVFMNPVSPASPPAPGLTPVTFNFKTLLGDSLLNVTLQYQIYTKSAQVYHMDSTNIFDYTQVFQARSNVNGQVTVNVVPNDSLLVEGGRTGQTWWMFQAYNGETGLPLLGKDGLKLKVPASAVGLTWPTDAASFSE